MNSKIATRIFRTMAQAALTTAFLLAALQAGAQAPARFMGTITAINGNTLTVKVDANGDRQVQVSGDVPIKRVAPGQKDLSTAESIQFGDLASGDRVLVKLDPDATGTTPQALQIIAIKQTDVAQKQQKDREDWQRRGVGGLVKSVDAAGGVIQIRSGAGPTAKTVTVHIGKTTMLKRYAPASISYESALPAPIDAIQPGDQLQARGAKNADGTEIAAEEVVSGSFRNISGTIASLDASGSTLVVKDLSTKKQVTIHITPDAQMRRLPDMMARGLAARLKGTTAAGGPGAASSAGAPPQNGSGGAPQRAWNGGQWGSQGSGQGGGRSGPGGGDPQQMLNRAPLITLADLKKGDAVLLVSTNATDNVTAIKLLAGVEPLLEAPAAQNLLANWSMNSSAPEVAQ
jgi:hypothetical protein